MRYFKRVTTANFTEKIKGIRFDKAFIMNEKKFNHDFQVNDLENNKVDDSYANFKAKLEQVQNFPDLYIFKFIIKDEGSKLEELRAVLPDDEFISQPSKTGKYQSITVKKWMQNADEVIAIYKAVGQIKDIIMM